MARALLLVALAAALAGAGCGYRVLGAGDRGSLWIAPVVDGGGEPLFGATLARALAREAVGRADASLASRESAAVHLAVRVDGVSEAGVAYGVGDVVREYRVTAAVTATATRPGGEVLWRGAGLRADRAYGAVPADASATEAAKGRALEVLAADLAREVLRRLALVRAGEGGR